MNPQNKMTDVLNELKGLTGQGEHQEALNLLMDYFRENSHPKVLAETIRLSLLLNKNAQALKLFFHLYKTDQWQEFIDANILLRLKLSFPHDRIVQRCELNPSFGGKWVASYLQKKKEKIYPANLTEWQLTCGDGRSYYNFQSKCLSCGHQHLVSVYMFFLIHREYLCPNCLAKQVLDYEILKSFFETDHVYKQLAGQVDIYDDKLIQLRVTLNNDSLSANEYPLLCQYLNIDYVFIFNQLIMNRLFAQ